MNGCIMQTQHELPNVYLSTEQGELQSYLYLLIKALVCGRLGEQKLPGLAQPGCFRFAMLKSK